MTLAKPTTRVRYLNGGEAIELSRAIPDPLLDPPLRLWIEADPQDLTRIGIVAVTSPRETAEEKRTPTVGQKTFWCTKEDLKWFIEHLPKVLAFLETGERPQ